MANQPLRPNQGQVSLTPPLSNENNNNTITPNIGSDALKTPAPPSTQATAQAQSPDAHQNLQSMAAHNLKAVTLSNDVIRLTISPVGGALTQLEVLTQQNAEKTGPYVLFGPQRQYQAQSGLVAGDGEHVPNHRSIFQIVPGKNSLESGDNSVSVRLETSTNQGVFAKIITLTRGSYVIDERWEIKNSGNKPIVAHPYYQFQRDLSPSEGSTFFMSTFTGVSVFTEQGKYQKVSLDDIVKGKAKYEKTANNGWLAMVQHYFVAGWFPEANVNREFYTRVITGEQNEPLVNAGVILPALTVQPGGSLQSSMRLFAGPQIQANLRQMSPDFDAVVDYGWLTMLANPMFRLLGWLHSLVGNWGWAVVALTLVVKLVFFPLSAASYKSMAKMKNVTPRMMQLKERYSDDRARLNQEMMKLYQTEKINPLGGCLPILIQIPVFISLYWVVLGAVEMRGAPWVMWIHDLSAPDPYYILPVIMIVSMFIQMKLNPTPPDPIQAKMMMIMPFVFGITFFWFPAALVLYWVVNNILSILQQWQITRMLGGHTNTAHASTAHTKPPVLKK